MKNIFLLTLILLFNTLYLLNAQNTLKDTDTAAVCLSPEERETNSLLNVFPNPSNGTFQIVYTSPTSCPPPGWGGLLLVNIIDPNGKIVYSESILDFDGEYNKTIDLSAHPKGFFYIIEVISGNQRKIKREMLN